MSQLIEHTTNHSVKQVLHKIEEFLSQHQVKVFSRISHSQAAKEDGLIMQDEELLIFGSPKVGTALMVDDPRIGIELPLKILAYRNDNHTVVAYRKLDYLLQQYDLKTSAHIVPTLQQLLEDAVSFAIQN